ncbi:MAG: hypothetical protein RDV48_08470 [Candidatus Eremiobacteraeota bacterium]|nr:hypothetical protein [Candidatus Eremiobacteraeota bacterium]
MNVNTHNNMAMMSSMVGIPQQTGQTKQVNKDLDEGKQITETDKPDDSQELTKDKANVNSQGNQMESVSRQQSRSVARRYVAEDYKTEQQAKGTENEQVQDSQLNQQSGTQPKGRLFLDTSSQIQHSFQKMQEQQLQQQSANNQAKMRPDVQRKIFAENLRKWVDVEYKQFVKQNDPLYTRRNLREILQALGDQDTQTKKTKSSSTDSLGKNSVQYSRYNKYNITQASKAMRIFEEIPSNIDNVDYDLVA